MTGQVVLHGVAHRSRHVDGSSSEPIDHGLGLEVDTGPVDAPALESGQVQGCFAHGLGGHGTGGHRPAEGGFRLDDGDAFVEVGGLGSGFLPCRPGPHHHHVEPFFHRSDLTFDAGSRGHHRQPKRGPTPAGS